MSHRVQQWPHYQSVQCLWRWFSRQAKSRELTSILQSRLGYFLEVKWTHIALSYTLVVKLQEAFLQAVCTRSFLEQASLLHQGLATLYWLLRWWRHCSRPLSFLLFSVWQQQPRMTTTGIMVLP